MRKVIRRNVLFFIMFLVIGILFFKRYSYLQIPIVSRPDSWIDFHTEESVLEQTWQPTVGILSGVDVPYYALDTFSGDVVLKIYSDDYSKVLVEAVNEDFLFKAGENGDIIFSFDRVKAEKGERLRIQISLQNVSDQGIVRITSGSDYGGCCIAGKDAEQAAALQITFAKNSRLFWIMAILFPLFSYSLFMMIVLGRKWEETIAVSLFVEGLILYFFGLAGHLQGGIYFLYLMAIGILLASIYLYNKKKMDFHDLFSPGLWIFSILFCLILLSSQGDWMGMRDDLRHWGIAVRDMFYYDSFANHVNTTVILPRYLPFSTLIEYVFEYANGMFHEGILFVAYQTMLLCISIIFSTLMQKGERKKWTLPVLTAMIGIPVLFFPNISSTIMVDSLMAAMAAYILICYYSEGMSWFNRVRICCAMCALALTKEMGLVLAGVSGLIIFGDIFFQGVRKKKIVIKELAYPVACVVLVIGIYFSWQVYLSVPVKNSVEKAVHEDFGQSEEKSIEEISEGESKEKENVIGSEVSQEKTKSAITASGITFEGLRDVFTGNGEWYQYQTTRNFFVKLLDGETYSVGPVKLSFVDFLVGIVFLVASLAFFGYWNVGREQKYIFSGVVLIAAACFCAFLQITYWFAFEMYEAMDLTSYDRYLAPYLCAIAMTVIYLIFEGNKHSKWEKKKADFLVYVLTIFIIIIMPVEGLVFESNRLEENTTQENTYGYDKLAEILRSMADKGEKVHFICSNSDGYAAYIFRNAVCPIVSEYDFWNIVPDQETYDRQYEIYREGEINIHNTAYLMSKEAWENEIRKCKYVVIFHADELFKQSYPELFRETTIQDGSVYQVMDASGDMFLRLVGSTEIRGYH